MSEDPIRAGLNFYTYCLNNPITFIDPSGLKNVVIVAGGDMASNNHSFKNNADTWVKDNFVKNDNVTILDIGNNEYTVIWTNGEGKTQRDTMELNYSDGADIMDIIMYANGPEGTTLIDEIIFETHSTSSMVLARSDIYLNAELFKEYFQKQMFVLYGTPILVEPKIKLSETAKITFKGCNVGFGGEGSLAQQVSNISKRDVIAATSKTSQIALKDGDFYQMSEIQIKKYLADGTVLALSENDGENDISLADYLMEWLQIKKSSIQKTTYWGYFVTLERTICPYFVVYCTKVCT